MSPESDLYPEPPHSPREQHGIKEIDINPLLASPDRIIALDSRVVVYGPDVGEDHLPRPTIRPYPTRYDRPWTLADGQAVTLHPIRAAHLRQTRLPPESR